jgi:hypothetical protein
MPLIAAVRECETCPVGANAFLDPRVGALIAAGGLAVMTLLIVAAAFLRYHDRQIPEWLIPTTAFAYGVSASLMVLLWPVTAGPVESVLFLALGFGPALLAARSRRFDLAGWILVGAGLLPLLWWGYYVVQDVTQEGIAYEDGLVVWFGSSAAIVLLGLVGVALGNRVLKAPPRPPPGEPDPERGLVIARAIIEELRFGPLDLPNALSIGLGAGAGVVLSLVLGALGVPIVIGGIAAVAAFTLIATELYYHVWPPRLARAEATHAFLGSWEVKRFRATTGRPVPTSIPLAREWLARQPETDGNRWVRPEFLALVGEIDEAYQVLGRMPSDTDDQRFERRSLKVFVDTLAGAAPDVDGLAAAAEEIGEPGSDERLRAVAAAAIARSRLVLARGEKDWTGPLLEAQARIGPRSLGIMRSDTWLLRFRAFALAGGMVIVIGATISWAFR